MTGTPSNLLQVYSRALPSERRMGQIYYTRQHDRLQALARRYSLSLATCAGAFAALSPNNDEDGNYRSLVTLLEAHRAGTPLSEFRVTTYHTNKRKAWDIVHGAPPLDILRGPKVTAFYRNTLDPQDPDPVTIDGHLFNAWCNTPGRTLVEVAAIARARHYTQAAKDLRIVAQAHSVIPCQLQSTIWIVWKRLHRIRHTAQIPIWLPEELEVLRHG